MGNQKRDPRGVGIDKDGAVWSVNYFSSSVTKLDAKTLAVVGEIKVGANPDSYGDFTGTPLMAIAAANGDYTYIFSPSGGKLGQKVKWESITVAADIADGTSLQLQWCSAVDAADYAKCTWSELVNVLPNQLPYILPVDGGKLDGWLLAVKVTLISKVKVKTPVLKCLTAQAKLQ